VGEPGSPDAHPVRLAKKSSTRHRRRTESPLYPLKERSHLVTRSEPHLLRGEPGTASWPLLRRSYATALGRPGAKAPPGSFDPPARVKLRVRVERFDRGGSRLRAARPADPRFTRRASVREWHLVGRLIGRQTHPVSERREGLSPKRRSGPRNASKSMRPCLRRPSPAGHVPAAGSGTQSRHRRCRPRSLRSVAGA
jgi:hypothetical protein